MAMKKFSGLPGTLALWAWVLWGSSACSTLQAESPYQNWQVIDVTQKMVVTFADLRPALLKADVIYVGETHYTPSHIEAALKILDALVQAGKSPTIGMEMFSWDGQSALDRYVRGEMSTVEEFLSESHWKDNWGGQYEGYSPLVDYAKQHGLKLLGLNPPRMLVRKVVQQGLAGIGSDPDLKKWNISDPFPEDDPDYRRVIYEQIEQCHGGMTPEVYEKIYEASVFRDEGMASMISTAIRSDADETQPFVSYTGSGHIQYGLPIPKRVERRSGGSVRQLTVYLHAFDRGYPEDVERLIQENIADFIWLTPLGPQGRTPRCGE